MEEINKIACKEKILWISWTTDSPRAKFPKKNMRRENKELIQKNKKR